MINCGLVLQSFRHGHRCIRFLEHALAWCCQTASRLCNVCAHSAGSGRGCHISGVSRHMAPLVSPHGAKSTGDVSFLWFLCRRRGGAAHVWAAHRVDRMGNVFLLLWLSGPWLVRVVAVAVVRTALQASNNIEGRITLYRNEHWSSDF